MKKLLTRGIAAVFAFSLITALSSPMPLMASSETGTGWNAAEMFSADTAEPAPWAYFASTDGGETFSLMSVYAEEEWGNYWYSAEKEIGLGTNNDVEGYLEANVADGNEAIAALGFTAPESGNYLIEASGVPNMWNQDGDEFLIRTLDTAYYVGAIENPGGEAFTLEIPEMVVSLEEGDTLLFHATTKGGWYSAMINFAVQPTEAEATVAGTPIGEDGQIDGGDDGVSEPPWNNVEDFSDAVAYPAPWRYEYSNDQGANWEEMTVFSTVEWGVFWYSAADSFVGAGLNNDANAYMELNASDNNAQISGLAFVAPETGNYRIDAFAVPNLWGQDGRTFQIELDGERIYEGTIENPEFESYAFDLEVPEMVVSMEEGEVLRFFTLTIGSWYSTYLDITINPTDDPEALPSGETEETTVETAEETAEETEPATSAESIPAETEAAVTPTAQTPTAAPASGDEGAAGGNTLPWVLAGIGALVLIGIIAAIALKRRR